MAVLWPRKLPRSVLDDPRRRAEVRVYDGLAHVLDDTFHVFYSSPWLGTDRLGNEKDGECDFLIAHPSHGILAIEVKGGKEISFDPEDAQWRSKDHGDFVHKIKDPVAQARSAKYEILKRLNESRRWPRRFIHAAHGVIFPSAGSPPGNLGADRPARIFCCSHQFQHGLREWVAERLKEGQSPDNCEPLGHDGIAALEKLLAHPFTLSFRIGAALAEAVGEFRVLEPSQYYVLDAITDIPRALIRGGAGTGKTVVAVEEALRSAAAGRKTLLTCHSRPLAMNLERRLKGVENLTVIGFHALCGHMASQVGVQIPSNVSERELYESLLPNALYSAMEVKPALKWDTIIVDEGQDFRAEWWIAIDACLNRNGNLRVFMDSNQKVYDSAGNGVHDLSVVPVRLSRNLRNTKNIHKAASVHYSGPDIVADGPDGLEVSWINAENPDSKVEAAYKELRRLVFNEEVAPGDIAVLVNGPAARTSFLERSSGTSIPLTDAETMALEEVVVDTVRRFKGLERPAIILIVSGDEMERRELAYVAFSRARAYLCVVCSKDEARWLSEKEIRDD
ncbi:nuclease-related domain-containing DEAD/DEAH box helicase [Burkholderia cepacia]|uniref:nuclease-related domain-containing DEAD/DEAH box helicase n=1 Tax=Burkholderia cepacia TaxID=292 RepID=UPI001CF2B8CA|nr:NERD domain-containing protein [Burkholderia cepacia]MCA8349943.1 NERD domain-containing protein [Burkholderia cepacia]